MKTFLSVLCASAVVLAPMAASAQVRDQHREDGGVIIRHPGGGVGGGDNGDRGPDRGGDRGDRGGGDRGGRGGHRGGDDVGGAIVGGIIGGLLGGGFNQNYRFRYDDDYYARRGYDRGYYDNWRGRDRGRGGCRMLGYDWSDGCRTIYADRDFVILNLRGDIYCFRQSYRGWRQTYCPRDWYNY